MRFVSYRNPTVRAAAEGLARRSGRVAIWQPEGPHDDDARGLEVFVGLVDDVDSTVLMELNQIARSRAYMPGIVTGTTVDEVAAFADKCSGSPYPKTGSVSRCDIMPMIEVAVARTPVRTIVGRDAAVEEVRRELNRKHSILYVCSHSDGIDLLLPGGSILCAIKSIEIHSAVRGRLPACVCSGKCYRRERPIACALQLPDVLGAAEIRADVLVLDACYLVPMAGNNPTIDRRWTLFSEICRTADFRCALLGLEQREGYAGDASVMLSMVQAGRRVGDAVGSFVASEYARASDICYALIGDPNYCLPGSTPLPGLEAKEHSITVMQNPNAHTMPMLPYVLSKLAPPGMFGRDPEAIEAAVAALPSEKILDILVDNGRGCIGIYEAWVQRSGRVSASLTICPSCGDAARARTMAVDSATEVRRVFRCWHCGATGDQPASTSVKLTWTDDHKVVRIACARALHAARLLVSAKGMSPRYRSVPLNPADLTCCDLSIPVAALGDLIGPVIVALIFLRGAEFGAYSIVHNFTGSMAVAHDT